LAYLPRPDSKDPFFPVSPEVAALNGNYAKVPMITGDLEDEGTLFSQAQNNITTTEQLVNYILSSFPETSRAAVEAAVATYPDDMTQGSPFRTGILNSIYPQYKRLAAMLGDAVFNLRRRQLLNIASSTVPMWSYLDSHLYGTPVLGTFHGSDLLSIFFGTPVGIQQKTYLDYYTSFINFLDPNALGNGLPLIGWPQYNTTKPTLLWLQTAHNTLLPDTYRSASYDALTGNVGAFRT
jgi:carboxylesterase type B